MIGDPKKKKYPPGFEPEQEEKPAMPSGFVPDMPTIKKKGFFSNIGQFVPTDTSEPQGLDRQSLLKKIGAKFDPNTGMHYVEGEQEKPLVIDEEDPLKSVMTPVRNEAMKIAKSYKAEQQRPVSESTGQSFLSPAQKYEKNQELFHRQNALQEADAAQEQLERQAIPDAEIATNVIVNHAAKKGVDIPLKSDGTADLSKIDLTKFGDNETVKASVKRVKEFDDVMNDINNGSSIIEAASNRLRRLNPHFNEQISTIEAGNTDKSPQMNIPHALLGKIVSDFVNDNPNLELAVKNNPKLKDEVDFLKGENIYKVFPEYGLNVIDNEISKARQVEGRNNWFANPIFSSSKYLDGLADRLYANDPIKKQLVEQYRKGQWEGHVDTPGLVEEAATGAKKAAQGFHRTVNDIFGAGESTAERIYRQLEEGSTQVSSGVGGVQKLLGQAANFGGMISLMAAGGSPLTAAKINPGVVNTYMTGMTFYDDELTNWTNKYPTNKWKAQAGAIASTLAFMFAHKAIPSSKLAESITKDLKPEIQGVLKNLDEGVITKEATKTMADKFAEVMGKWSKDTGKGALQMMGIGTFQQGLDRAFGLDEKTFQQYNQNIGDIGIGMIVGSAFPNLLVSYKNRNAVANSLNTIAENTEQSIKDLENQSFLGKEFSQDLRNKIDDIKFLSETKQKLVDDGVNPKDHPAYLLRSMNEKYLKQKAEATSEPSLKKRYTEQAKQESELKEGILNGIPEEKIIINQATKEVKDAYNSGYLDKKSAASLESKKTEEGEPKFDEDKVKTFLQEVAENPDKKVPNRIRELAEEMFPKEEEIKVPNNLKTTSIILPEENKGAENIPLIKTQQNAEDIRSNQGQSGVSGNEPRRSADKSSEDIQLDEKVPPINGETEQQAGIGSTEEKGQGAGETPPIEPTPNRAFVHIQYPPTQLSHGGVTRIGTEHEFEPENKYEKSSVLKWNKEADKLMDEWFSVQNLLQKVDAGEHLPSPAERVVLTRYAGELQKKLRDIKDVNNPDYDAALKELQRVANVANFGGSQIGASLGSIGHIKVIPDGSYAEFMLNELAANKDAPLTDNQKQTANKEFSRLELAKKRLDEDQKSFEEKVAAFRAEQEYGKIKKSTKKDTKKDFASERKQIVGDILLKLSKAGGEGASFLGVKELGSIAPDVLKLAKSFAEQGIEKLSEVIDNIHDLLKYRIPELEKRNIHDIIAGEFNERKVTKREAAIRMENLRIEAKLINKLEGLLKGEEPKNEKAKIKRNQEIESLRKQIKDFRTEERESEKFYPETKDAEFKQLESLQKKNEKETQKIKEKIVAGDFAPEEKKVPLLEDKELQKKFPDQFKKTQRSADEYIKVKREIALRRLKQMYENKTPEEKAVEIFSKSLNIPRTLMASFDFSAPLRQGIISTVAHPEIASKALKFMFESAKDEKVYNRWLEDVHNSPRWLIAKKTKLGITDPESLHVKQSEEAFQGAPYAEKIPIVGLGVKASERAYIGFLNKIRWDLFNMYADRFEDQGKTYENNPKLYEGISSMINSETGRGGLKGLENAAPVMNWFLFASKLIASRLNMLGLTDVPNLAVRGATLGKYGLDYGFYTRLPKELRVEAAKDMLKFIAAGVGFLAMAKGVSNIGGGNVTVEDDPRSSDFGKIRSGNQRWDIWGGFQPYARVLTQMLSGERKTTTTGEVKTIQDRSSIIGSFLRGKLAPVPAATLDLATGYDAAGQPVTIGGELLQEVTPLLFQDVYSAMKDQGVKALFTVGIPAAFGVGVQNYQSNKPKSSSHERPVHQP